MLIRHTRLPACLLQLLQLTICTFNPCVYYYQSAIIDLLALLFLAERGTLYNNRRLVLPTHESIANCLFRHYIFGNGEGELNPLFCQSVHLYFIDNLLWSATFTPSPLYLDLTRIVFIFIINAS